MSKNKYDNEELAVELKKIIDLRQLKAIYRLYFQKFDTLKKSSQSDIYKTRVIINTLADELLCNKFLDSIEEPIKTIILNLSWKDDFINNIQIKNQYGIDVTIKSTEYISFLNFLEKIDQRFHIFNIEQNYDFATSGYIFTFSLPSIIKRLICESLIEKPKEFNLLPV